MLSDLHTSSSAGGGPVGSFPAGTGTVYAVFNYSNFTGQKIGLRVHDAQGQELFNSGLQPYQGSGTQSFAVSAPGGSFPAGSYLTVLYGGEFAGPIASIFWQVEAAAPTPAPKSGAYADSFPQTNGRPGLANRLRDRARGQHEHTGPTAGSRGQLFPLRSPGWGKLR